MRTGNWAIIKFNIALDALGKTMGNMVMPLDALDKTMGNMVMPLKTLKDMMTLAKIENKPKKRLKGDK